MRRGWLGVNIQSVTDEIAEGVGLDKPRGALVARVPDNGPAAKAQIKSGDVIVRFDGKEVTDMRRLPRLVAETPVDKAVKVEVWRNRSSVTLEVKLGELEDEQQASAGPATPRPGQGPGQPQGQAEVLGMTLSPITPETRQRFQIGIAGVVRHAEFDQPPDADVLDAGKTQPVERMVHRASLRIEHAGLEADMDADFHGRRTFFECG